MIFKTVQAKRRRCRTYLQTKWCFHSSKNLLHIYSSLHSSLSKWKFECHRSIFLVIFRFTPHKICIDNKLFRHNYVTINFLFNKTDFTWRPISSSNDLFGYAHWTTYVDFLTFHLFRCVFILNSTFNSSFILHRYI